MKRIAAATAAALLPFLILFSVGTGPAIADDERFGSPCAAPNEIVGSYEETAWRIWGAATCPVNNNQYPYVVWENWIEQSQLYPDDPSKGLHVPNTGAATTPHILGPSPLTLTYH